ncbi:hypothetical protein K502DRAFT_332162 [Neoconidiobolus thromboides FSU 785]|nr:hypothetical protein K502DRAFT_332162 [Neoconidiobolus thromboides FSU 785]
MLKSFINNIYDELNLIKLTFDVVTGRIDGIKESEVQDKRGIKGSSQEIKREDKEEAKNGIKKNIDDYIETSELSISKQGRSIDPVKEQETKDNLIVKQETAESSIKQQQQEKPASVKWSEINGENAIDNLLFKIETKLLTKKTDTGPTTSRVLGNLNFKSNMFGTSIQLDTSIPETITKVAKDSTMEKNINEIISKCEEIVKNTGFYYLTSGTELDTPEGLNKTLLPTSLDDEFTKGIEISELYSKHEVFQKQIQQEVKEEAILNCGNHLALISNDIIDYYTKKVFPAISESEDWKEYIDVVNNRVKELFNVIQEYPEEMRRSAGEILEILTEASGLNHIIGEYLLFRIYSILIETVLTCKSKDSVDTLIKFSKCVYKIRPGFSEYIFIAKLVNENPYILFKDLNDRKMIHNIALKDHNALYQLQNQIKETESIVNKNKVTKLNVNYSASEDKRKEAYENLRIFNLNQLIDSLNIYQISN